MVRFGASELHNIAAIIGGVGAQVGSRTGVYLADDDGTAWVLYW